MSSINLDGGETTVIRTLGFGGVPMSGRELMERVQGMEAAELFEIIQTLAAVGYVSSDADFSHPDDLEKTKFFVNPGYARDLKEALNPRASEPKSRRVRRE